MTIRPAPNVRATEIEYDDDPLFGSASALLPGLTNFTFGGQTLPLSQLEPLAEAIEACFDLDFGGPVDPNGFTINGGSFSVIPVLDPSGAEMVSIKVGVMALTLGTASSLAEAARVALG